MKKPLFELGRIVGTPGALEEMAKANTNAMMLLLRHVTGDWGEVCEEDAKENELSVREGFRILSAYTLKTGVKIWIITESDRSATTFLLPSEYWGLKTQHSQQTAQSSTMPPSRIVPKRFVTQSVQRRADNST